MPYQTQSFNKCNCENLSLTIQKSILYWHSGWHTHDSKQYWPIWSKAKCRQAINKWLQLWKLTIAARARAGCTYYSIRKAGWDRQRCSLHTKNTLKCFGLCKKLCCLSHPAKKLLEEHTDIDNGKTYHTNRQQVCKCMIACGLGLREQDLAINISNGTMNCSLIMQMLK